jgi:hypothetical protein
MTIPGREHHRPDSDLTDVATFEFGGGRSAARVASRLL